jgi:hypothetical protein
MVATICFACAGLSFVPNAAAASPSKTFTLYSVTEQEQFVNNKDDRARGEGNNPFGNYKDVAPVAKQKTGPFPGDEALFSFNLYKDPTLKQRAGAAIFTCEYNFAKQAFCDVYFTLKASGTLVAAGGFDFNVGSFTLAVTGGYGAYSGNVGAVDETPGANHSQKLVFRLGATPRVAKTVRVEHSTLFSVPSEKQFVNNQDDRARGEGSNPFGNYYNGFAKTPTKEDPYGPFPGDEGEFASVLYTQPTRKTTAGSAIFVCQYNFYLDATCDASFQLDGGTLVAKGAYSFNATTFTVGIVGGTDKYAGAKGEVEVAALGSKTQAHPVYRVTPMLEVQRLNFAASKPCCGSSRTITVYSTPAQQTFVDNDDDEARGDINNPFGTRDTRQAAVTNEHDNGPFPGDEGLYSASVYADAHLKAHVGSVVFTCQYEFDKNAFCDAAIQLKGGTLTAAGALDFSASSYGLAITGGTGNYREASGQLKAVSVGKHTQRLSILLG